jgi:hypothetical protein
VIYSVGLALGLLGGIFATRLIERVCVHSTPEFRRGGVAPVDGCKRSVPYLRGALPASILPRHCATDSIHPYQLERSAE